MSIDSPRYRFPNGQEIIHYCKNHHLIQALSEDLRIKIIKPIALVFGNANETRNAIEVGIVATLASSRILSQQSYKEKFDRLYDIFREILFDLVCVPQKSS